MTDAILSPVFRQQFMLANGHLAVFGKLYSYVAGSAGGINKDTYSSISMSAVNPNPVVLDSGGCANVWLDPAGTYLLVLKDQFGNTIWSVDQVKGSAGSDAAVSVIEALLIQNTGAGLIGTLTGNTVQVQLNIVTSAIAGNTNSIAALTLRVTSLEADVATLKNNAISGMTGYATWALLNAAFLAYSGATVYTLGNTVTDQTAWWIYTNATPSSGNAPPALPVTSNAYWTLKLQVPAGQLAEVPLTDAGTHTDPVVGGTVSNTGIFRWSYSPVGWQRLYDTSAASAIPYRDQAAASAAAAAASAASILPRISDDTFVGARDVITPASVASTVSGKNFTISTSGVDYPAILTYDQVGDTTSTFNAVLQIVSGSPGTAFSVAIGRWYNSSNVQIGADVALTKTATQISLTGTQPAGAKSLHFFLTPPASTVCRFLAYQFGNPARPNTDAWYLAVLGAGVTLNDPRPIDYLATDAKYNPITGRVTVPATSGSDFTINIVTGVANGDVLWVLFDSPLEPMVWLQYVTAVFGAAGGGSGTGYVSQVLHLGGQRFAVSLAVQSAADGAFYGARWTWNNPGAATYFENVRAYVGTKPPFYEKLAAVQLRGVQDEIDKERIMPLLSLADDSCAISASQFQPAPGLVLASWLGSGTKFVNLATPGNTLAQSASTAGLLPIHVSVTGGVIPASTSPVVISAWDYDPITLGSTGNPAFDPYAYICGVLGRLSADAWTSNSPQAGHLFFTPVVAPRYPVPVPAGSKLILRASRRRKGGLTLFPISSVNSTGGGFANVIAFVDAVFAANDPATIAGFVGLTPSPTYDSGASLLSAFSAKSYFSRLFNPNIMSAATVAEAMSLFGWTWAAGENASWLAGTLGIPGSMRWAGDNFHPYTDVASYVVSKNIFISSQVTTYLENWG